MQPHGVPPSPRVHHNSSSDRSLNLVTGDGIGVGIYGSPDIKLFGKKTFNVKKYETLNFIEKIHVSRKFIEKL